MALAIAVVALTFRGRRRSLSEVEIEEAKVIFHESPQKAEATSQRVAGKVCRNCRNASAGYDL
jgi:hypothetical protein